MNPAEPPRPRRSGRLEHFPPLPAGLSRGLRSSKFSTFFPPRYFQQRPQHPAMLEHSVFPKKGPHTAAGAGARTPAGVTSPELRPAELLLTPRFVGQQPSRGLRPLWFAAQSGAAPAFHSCLLLEQFWGFFRTRPSGGATARGDVWLLFPLRPGCHLPLRQDGVRSVGVKRTFAYGHLGWPAQPERRSRLPCRQQRAAPRGQPSPKIPERWRRTKISFFALHLHVPSPASLASRYVHPCW